MWYRPDSAFEAILRREKLSLTQHLSLDDTDVLFYIKQWQASDDQILSDLANRFLHRKLFKAFDLDMPEDEKADFIEAAENTVAAAGFDPKFYFVDDAGGGAPYSFYTRGSGAVKDLIHVQDGYSRPAIREISEVSAAVRGLQKGYRIHRICFPAEVQGEIEKLYRQ